MSKRPFNPLRALEVLTRHRVRFVIIGGFAGNVHGSPLATFDLDVCYARDLENLQRLARALTEVHAYPRGWESGLPFILDAQTLRNGDVFTFETEVGDLDCMANPVGVGGFDELMRNAERMQIEGCEVFVAAISDLMRMKAATGRVKDRLGLEHLAALQEEIDSR